VTNRLSRRGFFGVAAAAAGAVIQDTVGCGGESTIRNGRAALRRL